MHNAQYLWLILRRKVAAAATTTATAFYSSSFYLRLAALGKKSRACAERKIRSDPLERIHAGVMLLSIK